MSSRASTSGSSSRDDGRPRTRGPRRRGIDGTGAWPVSWAHCAWFTLGGELRYLGRGAPDCVPVSRSLSGVSCHCTLHRRTRPALQGSHGVDRRTGTGRHGVTWPPGLAPGCSWKLPTTVSRLAHAWLRPFRLERLRRRPRSMSQPATFTGTGEPFARSVGSGLRGVALESPGQPMAPGGQRRTPPRYGICAPRRLGNISTRERPGGNVGGRLGAGLGSWERGRGLACAVHHRPTPVSNAHGLVHAKRPIRWFTTAWGRPAPPCRTPRSRTVVLVPGEPARGAAASASSGRSALKVNLCPAPAKCPPSPAAMGALRTPARAYGSCIEAGVSSHASAGTPALGAARSLWLVATCTCGAGPFFSQNSLVMALYRTFRTVRRRRSIPPQLRCPRARVRSCRYGDADRDDRPARVEFRFHRVP